MASSTENPFMLSRDRYGSTAHYLDVPAFTAALAEALGGTFVPPDDEMDRRERACILVEGFKLHVWRNYTHKGDRVAIGGGHPDNTKLRPSFRPSDLKWPEITVSTGRPMDTLARDVSRRVIEECEAPAIKLQAALKDRLEQVDGIAAAMKDTQAAFPALRVSKADEEATSASLYLNSGGVYLTGELYASGAVSVQHLGSISAARFRLVMEALTKSLEE